MKYCSNIFSILVTPFSRFSACLFSFHCLYSSTNKKEPCVHLKFNIITKIPNISHKIKMRTEKIATYLYIYILFELYRLQT